MSLVIGRWSHGGRTAVGVITGSDTDAGRNAGRPCRALGLVVPLPNLSTMRPLPRLANRQSGCVAPRRGCQAGGSHDRRRPPAAARRGPEEPAHGQVRRRDAGLVRVLPHDRRAASRPSRATSRTSWAATGWRSVSALGRWPSRPCCCAPGSGRWGTCRSPGARSGGLCGRGGVGARLHVGELAVDPGARPLGHGRGRGRHVRRASRPRPRTWPPTTGEARPRPTSRSPVRRPRLGPVVGEALVGEGYTTVWVVLAALGRRCPDQPPDPQGQHGRRGAGPAVPPGRCGVAGRDPVPRPHPVHRLLGVRAAVRRGPGIRELRRGVGALCRPGLRRPCPRRPPARPPGLAAGLDDRAVWRDGGDLAGRRVGDDGRRSGWRRSSSPAGCHCSTRRCSWR